jgi:hypothetical protein
MNAAIDQQCEKYIIANNLKNEVNKIIESKFKKGELPAMQARMENPSSLKKENSKGHCQRVMMDWVYGYWDYPARMYYPRKYMKK